MKKYYLSFFISLIVGFSHAQTNLNLSSVASASASSAGSYGPSNWNDGIINGATFGWVGTAPNQPSPSYMEFSWSTAQTFDSIRVFNVGSNFAPPNGNGVVFTGTADLEYYNGTQWVNITSFSGQGTYGDVYALTFAPVTGTKFRIVNLNTGTNPTNHNPGFDEIEVYLSPQPPAIFDAALSTVDTMLAVANKELLISAKITNVGNQVLDTVALVYQVSNSTTIINETFYVMLAPNADTTLMLSQAIDLDTLPSPLSSENLCVWVSTAMDVANANDTLCLSLLPLQVEEDNLADEITVYPNPARGQFVVESLNPLTEISIYRIDGQLVYRIGLDSMVREEIKHNLPNGIYLMLLNSQTGSKITRLVIQD